MGATTTTQHVTKARKSHNCSWCAQTINKGQPYSRYRWFDGSDASTVKMHPECYAAMERLTIEEGEIEFYPGEHKRGCYCEHGEFCSFCTDDEGV